MERTTSRRTLLATAFGAGTALVVATVPGSPAMAADGGGTWNVQERGATGDGSTDDAPAINAAIERLAEQGGGVLEFPRGAYLVQSPVVLRSGVHLVSAASNHGYIAVQRRITTALLVGGAALRGWVVDSPSDALLSAGITGIDVQGTTSTGGIRLRKPTWCSVRRVHVNGTRDQGLLVEGGMASVFEDLLITNALLDRSRARVQGAFDLSGTDHAVSRCEFTASVTTRSSPDKRVVAAVVRGTNHFVSDSVAETSDAGWWITADSSRFTGVRGDTNLGEGFVVGGGSNVFAACSSVGNSQYRSGTYDGWSVRGGGNSFAACNVVTSSAKLVRYGFRDTVNNRDARARNSYVGCMVDRAKKSRWHTEGFLGSVPTAGGHAVRPASGTTRIDVGDVGIVALFDYRRATTIREFAGGAEGQTIRLLGNPLVSVMPGPGLVTASGRKVRLKRGRTYTFTRYDDTWYQST